MTQFYNIINELDALQGGGHESPRFQGGPKNYLDKREVLTYKAESHAFVWTRSLAGVAQPAEQLICNQQVAGSSPIASSDRTSDAFGSGAAVAAEWK